MPPSLLHVHLKKEEESWTSFARRIRETDGEVVVVLSGADKNFLSDEEERRQFLSELAKLRYRVKLATKQESIIKTARSLGVSVITTTRELKKLLAGHAQADEALRLFSPHLWRQFWRSRLQNMGLLALPKVRIISLICLSAVLFFFVVFRLLPSAEVRVWPRQDTITQTTNIVLAGSGAVTGLPPRVKMQPLIPITVTVHRTITFDQISKEFTGSNSQTMMTLFNTTTEPFGLKKGTRLVNQAGMVFRLQESATIPAGGSVSTKATADNQDLYGEDIGERGNVPAGLKWEFPGLSVETRKLVYAINKAPATGGKTASRTVLQQKDLDTARKRLEMELLATAKQMIEEERLARNANDTNHDLAFLTKDDVIRAVFSDFIMPTQFLKQAVQSVPVEGTLQYTMYAYDAKELLKVLSQELESHALEGRRLLKDALSADRLKVYVIAYADDLSWIKLTVDLIGTEEFILDGLTPSGAVFARKLREQIAGVERKKAIGIIKNFPEVEKVEIGLWPPWSRTLPPIHSHISVIAQ